MKKILIKILQIISKNIQIKGFPKFILFIKNILFNSNTVYNAYNNVNLKILPNVGFHCLNILNHGGFDTIKIFEKYLTLGDNFIDIGANLGYMSINASKIVGPKGKIISFEPDNTIYNLLENNISLICACKNRNEALKVSLNSWLNYKEIKEFIIVDWSSDESLRELIHLDPRIKVINVPNQIYFNQPQPLNLAAKISTGDYILKVDTDYILNPYHDFFGHYKIDNQSFLCGQHDYEQDEIASSPYFKYLRGLLYISRENYLKVGGYNEIHTQYYAYEDDEIVSVLPYVAG